MTDKRDRLEDAIYASPIGSTTPWRCKECGTAIARLGQPCKCTPELLKKQVAEDLRRAAEGYVDGRPAPEKKNPLTEELPIEVDTDLESHVAVGVKVKF